jgi:transcriptional regulator with XRE-family HTH domain
MKEKKLFGKILKNLRKDKGISQGMVAECVGVSQQCVSQWENGQIEPTLTFLWRLADFFDISVDELIGRKDF